MPAEKPAQIAFKSDRRGREMAFRWSRPGHMWIRMAMSEANEMIASGAGIVVTWHQRGPA